MTADPGLKSPDETAFAAAQKQHLVKSMRRFDMVFLTFSAIVTLDVIGQAASNNYQALTWALVLVFLFLVPYGLVIAEMGSAFDAEGGPYEWVKMTMGRFTAGLNTVLYWITNPLWIGGSLAFVGTAAWTSGISHLSSGSALDYVFKLLFIWITISSAIVSLQIGKWVPTIGSVIKLVLVAFFVITVIIYGIDHGFQGIRASELKPTGAGSLSIIPLLLFAFVGFEAQSGAAGEMVDPQRDIPQSILRSGLLTAACYVTPVLFVLLVLPAGQITGLGGFLEAVKLSYSVYGGAAGTLYGITCVLFILTLVNSGSAWLIAGDRVLAVAAADGGFFPYFGSFNSRLGTPLKANVLSALTASGFAVAATILLDSGAAATFGVVLDIAISTTVLSYLLIFPAGYLLRKRRPEVPRPFRVGRRGDRLMLLCVSVITAWVAFGSWTAIFPGTLNRLFGLSYSFSNEWGASQAKFELFTLGTLAAIAALAAVGYLAAAGVRRTTVGGHQDSASHPIEVSQ